MFLRGDAAVQYQDLMEVFDPLKAAGVENVGLVASDAGRALMDVTDVLRDRMQEPGRAAADGDRSRSRVHALLAAALVLRAAGGLLARAARIAATIMTISLGGGGTGPRNGGMTRSADGRCRR